MGLPYLQYRQVERQAPSLEGCLPSFKVFECLVQRRAGDDAVVCIGHCFVAVQCVHLSLRVAHNMAVITPKCCHCSPFVYFRESIANVGMTSLRLCAHGGQLCRAPAIYTGVSCHGGGRTSPSRICGCPPDHGWLAFVQVGNCLLYPGIVEQNRAPHLGWHSGQELPQGGRQPLSQKQSCNFLVGDEAQN